MSGESGKGAPLLGPAVILAGLLYAVFGARALDALPPDWGAVALPVVLIVAAVFAVRVARALLIGTLDLLRILKMLRPKTSHGSARWATRADARSAGLHRNAGLFLGVHEGRVIQYENETHTLVVAPTGAGKTVKTVLPQLARVDMSMLITDLKGELMVQSKQYRERWFGHRTVTLNAPEEYGYAPGAYNVCQLVLDDLARSPRDAIADARAIALQLLRDPPHKDQNQYFRQGGRSIIEVGILGLGVRSPGECSLVTVQRLVTDVPVFIEFLGDLRNETALQGDIAAMAESLIACHERTPRQFQDFINGAVQALAPYAPSGRLAALSDRCTFRFYEMKRMPMTIYVCCDMTRMKVFADWIALINWAAMVELQREGNSNPVMLLLDEAANFAIDGLPAMLTALRGYGIRVFMVFQELEDIARVYGREALTVIRSQCKVQIYFGSSAETAEKLQTMMGNETIEAPSFGLAPVGGGSLSENRGFVARPLMTASEIRQLPQDQQIVLIGNLPPLLCWSIGYHEMVPMRARLAANPFHSGRKFIGTLKVSFWGRPIAFGTARRSLLPKRPGVTRRLAGVLGTRAIVPLVKVALIAALAFPFYAWGTPHLRVSYGAYGSREAPRYVWCDYLGWNSHRAAGPDCPLIVWRKSKP